MPIYSYRCRKCGHTFEQLVGVTAESTELKCDKCGHRDVEKTMSPFAVRMGASKAVASSSGASSCATGTCCPTCN
jgi:putative FmdB family regulatory protein